MASSKDYFHFIMDQLSGLDAVSCRAMMGEYILYYRGKIIVGQSDALFRRKQMEEKRFYWKFCEPYWINNAPVLHDFCRAVAGAGLQDSTVVALVEDGLFEEAISPSVGFCCSPAALLSVSTWARRMSSPPPTQSRLPCARTPVAKGIPSRRSCR